MFIRRKSYDELKSNRDFWKKQFESQKDEMDFLREQNKTLVADRDSYKEYAESEHKKYMRIMASNRGYASSANKARKRAVIAENEVKNLRMKLAITGLAGNANLHHTGRHTSESITKSYIKPTKNKKKK